jgi:2-keto-4-pentenoate hydratase/2-oxohepta-3-ene-1,7-dioic acid hydratase in catechol pathway
VKEADALSVVAGYTVINDISDRKFRPNPQRKKREKDSFFDWLHGKWHDSFCPCGPCILSADALPDPQTLPLRLALNGQTQQDASTALMIFPVAAVVEFISSFVTLEPGDIISTGTPAGVGNAKGLYLKPGDTLEATIGLVGTLTTPVRAEE